MTEPRFDIPLEDAEEEARDLEAEDTTPAEGEPLPEPEPDLSRDTANEADVIEQSQVVVGSEDYPYGPSEE